MCLKITLYSLLEQPEFYFLFSQKQRYLAWSFTESASFISVHIGIGFRYSEINKFKTRKDLSFPKWQKHTKKCWFFPLTTSFPNFSVKRNYDKTSTTLAGFIQFVLVIRIYFDKNLNYPKVQVARILVKITSQVPSFLNIFKTKYISNTEENKQILVISFSFYMHNFKLKTEAIID